LTSGAVRVLWLCGLPYVDMAENSLELLAVPIPVGERYRDRAVYFSDLIVRPRSTLRIPRRSLRRLVGLQ